MAPPWRGDQGRGIRGDPRHESDGRGNGFGGATRGSCESRRVLRFTWRRRDQNLLGNGSRRAQLSCCTETGRTLRRGRGRDRGASGVRRGFGGNGRSTWASDFGMHINQTVWDGAGDDSSQGTHPQRRTWRIGSVSEKGGGDCFVRAKEAERVCRGGPRI